MCVDSVIMKHVCNCSFSHRDKRDFVSCGAAGVAGFYDRANMDIMRGRDKTIDNTDQLLQPLPRRRQSLFCLCAAFFLLVIAECLIRYLQLFPQKCSKLESFHHTNTHLIKSHTPGVNLLQLLLHCES